MCSWYSLISFWGAKLAAADYLQMTSWENILQITEDKYIKKLKHLLQKVIDTNKNSVLWSRVSALHGANSMKCQNYYIAVKNESSFKRMPCIKDLDKNCKMIEMWHWKIAEGYWKIKSAYFTEKCWIAA